MRSKVSFKLNIDTELSVGVGKPMEICENTNGQHETESIGCGLNMKQIILALLLLLCVTACSSNRDQGLSQLSDEVDGLQLENSLDSDAGRIELPGEPGLLGGLRNVPDPDADLPLPKVTASAGVDFASNRLVVIWEAQPDPAALAPFLGGGPSSDLKRAQDNHPLVVHPFLRRVSHNFAKHYGLTEFNRVFYKDVNFTSYETSGLTDVGQLDLLMQQVLDENIGLVREVVYDFYVEAASPDQPGSILLDILEATEIAEDGPIGRNRTIDVNRTTSAPPDDPMHLNVDGSTGGTWANWRVGAVDGEAWDSTTGDAGIVVAVIDTGTRYTHEDLAANCIDPTSDAPYNEPGILTDVINKDNDPNDDHNHGTWCAGNVGAVGNNTKGLAGINHVVTILPIKVLAGNGSGSDAQVAEGMLLADFLGAEIFSLSLTSPFPERIMQLACQQADDDGVFVIVAAGNYNNGSPHYPAFYPYVLGVGATTLVNDSNSQDFSLVDGSLPVDTRHDGRATFSNYGSWVDVAAPGVRVRTTDKASDSAYRASVAGTSFACPYTAGCAALLWAHMGLDATNDEVRGMLQSSATVMDHVNTGASPDGFIDDSTNGPVRFVNVYEAIQLFDGGPYEAPTVTWNNPTGGSTVSGTVDLQVSVTGGDGNVVKVEFDTPTRHLGTTEAESGGFWQVPWDSTFEFNGEMTITAKVHDDVGNIVHEPVTVTTDNTRVVPPWLEAFDGVALDAIPSDWYMIDENGGVSGNTSWGADDSQFGVATPSMHSNGTDTNYASFSNDWLYAPIIDLTGFASASISFDRRYERGNGDAFYFFVTADDESWGGTGFGTSGLQDWDTYTYDLSPYAGGEVRLLWHLRANGSNQNVGMWLDDIDISVATGTAPTIEITSPTTGSTVSGMVTMEMTISDDTEGVEIIGVPVNVGSLWYTTLPDNDLANPTKTLTISWDSRRTWNGGALITARAYDDEDDDDELDDLMAHDSIAVTVDNVLGGSTWFEGFEDIGTLGGVDSGEFDGDWYTWSFGSSLWRAGTHDAWNGSQHAYLGPDGGGDYGSNEFDQLYSPMFDLSTSVNPHLRFWHKLDVEGGNGDKAVLYLVRYDALRDLELNMFEDRSDTTGYERVVLDLSAHADNPFRLNFLFDSDGDANVGAGWSLDDMEVIDVDPTIVDIVDPTGHPGKVVTINGSNFGNVQGLSVVSFQKDGGGLTNPTITSWGHDAISLEVPADGISGDVFVTIIGVDSNAVYFGVTLPPPSLDGLGQI